MSAAPEHPTGLQEQQQPELREHEPLTLHDFFFWDNFEMWNDFFFMNFFQSLTVTPSKQGHIFFPVMASLSFAICVRSVYCVDASGKLDSMKETLRENAINYGLWTEHPEQHTISGMLSNLLSWNGFFCLLFFVSLAREKSLNTCLIRIFYVFLAAELYFRNLEGRLEVFKARVRAFFTTLGLWDENMFEMAQ